MEQSRRSPPYEGHSSGSEAKHSTPALKKRPSRAGTRSVTTLTAAQLERKRANDREAQRAIRQRTKDHIDTLERQVRDLTAQLDTSSSSKIMELMQRNDELEQENAVLRARLSHAVSALGVPEQSTGAPSPSDRVQMLSQPRRGSTGTRSVTELATPVSQSGHWQPHSYTHHVSSPHVDTPPPMETPHLDSARWSPHPSHPQHSVSLAVQDPSIHTIDSTSMSYPSPYDTRAMSYPLENAPLVTSQPLPTMSGYATPTSHHSPHPDYQRHVSVPMHHQAPGQGQPQPTSAPYSSYQPMPQQSGYSTPVSAHAEPMPMMHQAPLDQPHMMYMQPNMKVEH